MHHAIESQAFSTVSVGLRCAFGMAAELVEKRADDARLMEIPTTSNDTGEAAIA